MPDPAPRRVRRLLGALAVLLVAAPGLACGGGDDEGGGLPRVEGTDPPAAYRILYEVTTPEGSSQEEHVVHRPFEAQITERAGDDVLSQRTSALGRLATRTGDEGFAVETAIAPASGDLRPERFAERLVAAGRLDRGEGGAVGGRPCERFTEDARLATASATGRDTFPVRTTRCVDALGLVLEERIETPGGRTIRTKRAVSVEVGDEVPDPEAEGELDPLAPEEGGGRVEELASAPGTGSWRLRPPEGFVPVGRYTVEAATLGAGPPGSVTLETDVWSRGPDLLLLDVGTAAAGVTPFDAATAVEALELEDLGPATLALDLHLAEVRLVLADGRFVRVAGTLPVDELLAVARTLRRA